MVEGVSKHFDGLLAVNDASLTVEAGSITALIGPNGAGKSTLFNIISGFVRPDRGQIRLDSRPIFRASPHAIAREGLVRTFQLTKTLGTMTVLDNMLVAMPHHPGERLSRLLSRPRAVRRTEREARKRALGLLQTFHLDGHAGAYASSLSGGQRKLLELARALMTRPRLLLLDEPLSGVNPVLGESLMEHIEELRSEGGMTVLFIEHDIGAVMRRAERVIVMAEGRVIMEGSPDLVRRDDRVKTAYLGRTDRAG